jgi:hypothetical protein
MEYRRRVMAEWEVRPAKPILKETTGDDADDQVYGLPKKYLLLLRKCFGTKGIISTTGDGSTTPNP